MNIESIVKKFEKTGVVEGVTFRQAAGVITQETWNDVIINPFDEKSIKRASLYFGENNSGIYPSISPIIGGGFTYRTISGRKIKVLPDKDGWTLDCSDWWFCSENFRESILECFKKVLLDKSSWDKSIPDPELDHIHGGEELIGDIFHLHHTPGNNHGCSGFRIEIKATSKNEGMVLNGSSCSSCWQEGCDCSDSPIPLGTVVRLPEGYCWNCASEDNPNFMSSMDISRNGSSMVKPGELIY